nr:endogenous retrovirus group PABLB member 1 Env polyprotein-like [Vicugna pacos]
MLSALAWCSIKVMHSEFFFDLNATEKEANDLYRRTPEQAKQQEADISGRLTGQVYQIWDEYMWITPETGKLTNPADICWEQKEQPCGYNERTLTKKDWKYLGYTSQRLCKWTIDVTFIRKKPFKWPGSDWTNPGYRWVAPNGTKWICGTNVWPWLPWLPCGWVGRCTLGFVIAPGRIVKSVQGIPANMPNLHARWTRAAFKWYDYLAAIFLPSLGNVDVMTKVNALTNFTQKALTDVKHAVEELNAEQKLMRKAVLQNRMALDIITAAQVGTCAIIKVECCVFIPDVSGNVSQAVEDMQEQIRNMDSPTPFFPAQWFDWFKSDWWKHALVIVIIILILICMAPCILSCLSEFLTQRMLAFSHIHQQN